ncbi:hypothetical protein SERLA73DRAFT_179580 [Serpula lacrymans var. lacrymans S7.3]|uniref:Amidohydrolase 3 domain-containing protein n=2 Tax=Serpula lacrymans var. lacrymans TaxID=341189 RepID=F8PVH2_SERL3|nr:uncharacterized protein SERLADRAFT_464765 [Serpula lacrymans var. lacrymans S7.9]EGN99525.1 hypothetical protein SERLA73DRAFT_179580 [Serpula lacrymans var. lacrymans S7.3]EGO25098.1 hypothetical protein SERLADRAFT_464765 [Serpula lacrymans var. lacrymans S7.9]
MVVSDSHIMDTGSLEDIKSRWGILNASSSPLHIRYIKDGSIVLPGLSDSHAHILEYGASRQLSLEGGKTIKDTVALVKRYILENADVQKDRSRVIEGWGWDHTSWPVEQWPHMDDFEKDPIVRGRSIILQSKDGHALWISPHVLNTSLPFPNEVEGGVIVRDEFRNPTGVLLDNAQELIQKPPLTEDDLLKRFAATVKDALANGLTSVHDAGLNPLSLAFFKRQVAAGNMPIRIYGMTFFEENGPYWGNLSKPIIGASNGRFSARSVKIFADGALRSGGAALFEPYHDNPETNGFMRLDPAVLYDVIPRFLSDGWQVNVHAIGDRANSIVLDAFESTLKNVNVTALRPRLEHAQILTEADMARVGKLGVIASIQPTHAISDMWYAEDRLGPERVKGLYAFRSLINHGARLALGSDFPVEDMNPLSGFYSAVTRLSFDGRSPHGTAGWFPDQRLTRQEALRGMTIDAAYASFTDSEVGSLVPGKRADYVVLSQDIMTVPVGQILDTKVFATAIDGRPVFGEI